MLADAGSWVTLVLGLLGVVAVLGSATAYLRASRAKALIEFNEAELKAHQTALERLRAERTDLLARITILEGKVETYARERDVLKEAVQGRVEFSALETVVASLFAEHQTHADERHQAICRDLREIKALLGDRRAQ